MIWEAVVPGITYPGCFDSQASVEPKLVTKPWFVAGKRYRGLLRAKELPVGVQVPFARVRTWHEIGMRAGWQDPEDLDLAAFRARDRFRALQTFKWLARWGHIAAICIEKAEHVIE